MSLRWRIVLLSVVLAAACGGDRGGWTVQELGTDVEIRDVFFLDARRGWIVGGGHNVEGGFLGSTEDGGRSWRFRSGIVRPSPRARLFHLNAVRFLDAGEGFIAADRGLILRTVDGGESWHPVHRERRAGAHLFDLQFVDGQHGWAAGRFLLRTSDGGSTWHRPLPGAAGASFSSRAIHFLDRRRGWAVGDFGQVLHTEDGGETWNPVGEPPASGRPDLLALDFAGFEQGWIVGEGGTILHTADGGRSWSAQSSGTAALLTGVDFVDASRGWAVGFERQEGTSIVLHTADGGARWRPQLEVEGEELWALFFTDDRHGWAVGQRVRPASQKLLRYEGEP